MAELAGGFGTVECRGRKAAEHRQSTSMMACVLRGRLRFCAVFLTPSAPPNALQRIQLGQISQYNGG